LTRDCQHWRQSVSNTQSKLQAAYSGNNAGGHIAPIVAVRCHFLAGMSTEMCGSRVWRTSLPSLEYSKTCGMSVASKVGKGSARIAKWSLDGIIANWRKYLP